jgi:hypothetical protein
LMHLVVGAVENPPYSYQFRGESRVAQASVDTHQDRIDALSMLPSMLPWMVLVARAFILSLPSPWRPSGASPLPHASSTSRSAPHASTPPAARPVQEQRISNSSLNPWEMRASINGSRCRDGSPWRKALRGAAPGVLLAMPEEKAMTKRHGPGVLLGL